MKRMTWLTAEIQQLVALTDQYRSTGKQVKWGAICRQIPNRTLSQCKCYYSNVLKKHLDVEVRQNHMWNRVEIMALWTYCVVYNKDYAFVQKNFMSKFTARQISSQFIQIARKQQEMLQVFKAVLEDPSSVRALSESDFKMQWWILRMACGRLDLIQEKLRYEAQGAGVNARLPADFAEIPALEAFFQDVDPHALLPAYKQEEIRRGLDTEPFYEPEYQDNFMQ
ncbi:Myb-like_DNA-binding domain-containing protein [Hexamita inflata]|uniref:Myb-like DNA-binding domain-containing protein n=1 Tax=Hexamita inflata TaxID=28002 RepID=A0AA86PW15_9EUKA|nr:Myb-like DNA-binding domain-containing protein [Hexamita inflata]CAI9947415.1 Myb-like DNA-binding domain-containing protein [Hexamita inflata]CAI9947416.1 Myb-like DNA-binding domain-containing protein [Hexamita inflata]CAI9947423.1 Myb-like DNA-binding domain-containing protein [Hexamita inflata]CAI9947424.1 Myb-like DNA-binding domain-containing protein [Hexamita inflata]